MPATPAATPEDLPYSFDKLDALMEKAGIDLLLATSKHNTQYLLGGYRFIFFSAMDAIGHSRYLPVVLYRRGRPGGVTARKTNESGPGSGRSPSAAKACQSAGGSPGQ